MRDVLSKKRLCFCCLQKYSPNHKNECKAESFDKTKNKYVSKLCTLCSSKLNKYICPCKSSPSTTVPQKPALAVPMPTGNGTLPNVTPSSLHSSKNATGSRSNVTSVYNFKIELNGSVLGRSQCCVQVIRLLSPDNEIIDILGLWDTGCETTVCSANLCKFFWGSKQVGVPSVFHV